MSEKSREEIIKDYERSKAQEGKIDTLNENIVKLTEVLTKILPGEKKEGKEGKEGKSKVPTKIEPKEDEKKKEKEDTQTSVIGRFLGF